MVWKPTGAKPALEGVWLRDMQVVFDSVLVLYVYCVISISSSSQNRGSVAVPIQLDNNTA